MAEPRTNCFFGETYFFDIVYHLRMPGRNHFSYEGVEQEKLGRVLRYGKRRFLQNVWKMNIIRSKMVGLLTQNFNYSTIIGVFLLPRMF